MRSDADRSDDLVDDYEAAGFRGTLPWGDAPALLVIDWSRAYLDEASPLYAGPGAAAAAEHTAHLIKAARAGGSPVVFTRVEFTPEQRDGVFYRKVPALACFDTGNPLGDWPSRPAELTPEAGDLVVTKRTASAFAGTTLEVDLRRLGVDTIVIAGVSTSGCVRATTVDVCQLDFVPKVVREAVADRDPRPHEAALFDLDAKYADVVGGPEALRHLRRKP